MAIEKTRNNLFYDNSDYKYIHIYLLFSNISQFETLRKNYTSTISR